MLACLGSNSARSVVLQPQPGVRVAAPCAGAGAWRVDQHPIERPRAPFQPFVARFHQMTLDIMHAGSAQAAHRAVQPRRRNIAGDDLPAVLHRPRQRKGLAAGTGAPVHHPHPGRGTDHRGDQLAAFVLDLDQSGLEGRPAGDRAPAVDAQAPRRQFGRLGLPPFGGQRGYGLVAVALQQVDAHVERRRFGSAAISAGRLGPKRAASRGSSQSGISSRTASGMVGWSIVCPAIRDSTAFSAPDSGAAANCPPENACATPDFAHPSSSSDAATNRRDDCAARQATSRGAGGRAARSRRDPTRRAGHRSRYSGGTEKNRWRRRRRGVSGRPRSPPADRSRRRCARRGSSRQVGGSRQVRHFSHRWPE